MNSPLLGLDIGLRRTGVALSESGLIAQPLKTIEWQPPHAASLIAEIMNLVKHYQVQTLVVGVPYDDEGEVTGQAVKTERLIHQIEVEIRQQSLSATIERFNEYHSTLDARQLFPGEDKDAAAAAVILQDYIEQNGDSW